ncbi:hypothetical protein [Shouchella patagoniensis]|uniref:hypothetical protein n=1 Tax=Shouchella patagoniensis TaxID=228576 RepID=UPI000994BCAC|nr:hypothetical protein [Shouchella patagoniensis]
MTDKLEKFKKDYFDEIEKINYTIRQLRDGRVRELRHNNDPYLLTHAENLDENLENLYKSILNINEDRGKDKINDIFKKEK